MIAFIITTFMRDELLFKSVQSILDNWQDDFQIIVVDQGEVTAKKHEWINKQDKVHYVPVLYDSGLSYCRNVGVQKAKELGCDYVIIASDSFLFNESIKKIDNVVQILNNSYYDVIGFELIPSVCGWEAKLDLIEGKCFLLNFIDKDKTNAMRFLSTIKPSTKWKNVDESPALVGDVINIWNCDIIRNIFIAKINILLNCKWDNDLKLGEHEDFFYRLKLQNIKCSWTNYIYCNKMTDRPEQYAKLRKQNFNNGIKLLREKYNISGWVEYENLDRAKNYQKYSGLDKP